MKINFKKFIEYTQIVKEKDDLAISEMMRLFFPKRMDVDKCTMIFNSAVENITPEKLPIWYKVDLGLKRAAKFIDADTFLNEDMLLEFVDTVVKHRLPFCKVNLTINQARYLIDFFVNARGK